ncbi:DNA-binding transcriptional LysR family regulator [Lactobacillus colini]|uniref:DNA-binding transcriptional LysR family regulator n=1 Tax=Lactobacillus colini TaxID=1819254 RepID=A0ABS4MH55_9LACO|nr:LysR family transcriptional regulator [Lactobacillus colini]MBP2058652.1 DNA-binding transcriptional LysR family regulator [Lactobacillus colini]
MEINRLKTFVDLSQTLNFSETAANLYITQSSVSKHIKSLEKEIGHPLFVRNNKHVVLSDYGKVMLPYAEVILLKYEQMNMKFTELDAQRRKQIIIGTIPTIANYDIFTKITTYIQNHPELQITLKECETADIYNNLLAGKFDLAFIRKIDKLPASFNQIDIKQESFKLYLPDDDVLTQQEVINISELKDRNFISLDQDSLLQEPVIKLCRKSGFEPRITFVSDRVTSILEMVKNKQGVAIMMDSLPVWQGVAVRKITPTINGNLMFIKKKTLNFAALNNLWNFLKK